MFDSGKGLVKCRHGAVAMFKVCPSIEDEFWIVVSLLGSGLKQLSNCVNFILPSEGNTR